MTFTKLDMDKNNRMFTLIRIGKNDGKWFVRTDLWWIGFRISQDHKVRNK